MKILLLASTLLVLSAAMVPGFTQSLPEKIGVNQAMGIAPKTQDFVLEAALGDMLEIASSKLALTKADNDKTRQFAAQMIKDHTATSDELKGLIAAGKVKAAAPAAMDREHLDRLDRLGKMDARDFTQEYNDMQLAAHKEAVSLFGRYGKGGENADLRAFANRTLPHLQGHLKMAKALNK